MMTKEEKAKAYDEALEQAKKELKTCGSLDCDAVRQIFRFFPELSESEDERIRKSLIKFLTDIKRISESGRTKWAVRKEDAEMCKSSLAYLEKQKEQKPAEWSERDELMRTAIIQTLERFVGYRMQIDWLKSLRPSWKPSKVQLTALDNARHTNGNHSLLDSLYDDLKKLM